jgi:hypothetical protein
MTKHTYYEVEVQRTHAHDWFGLCRCDSPEALVAIISALTRATWESEAMIRVTIQFQLRDEPDGAGREQL